MSKEEIIKKPFYLIAKYWLGKLQGFIKIGDNKEEIIKLYEEKYKSIPEHDWGVTEESYQLLEVNAKEILEDKDMLGLKEENQELKKQLEEYKEEKQEWINLLDMFKNQQKEFISYLENEKDRLSRECSQIYEDSLGKTRLVNEDIFNEVNDILQKYKSIIGVLDEKSNNISS